MALRLQLLFSFLMLVASPYFVKADTISVTAPPEAVSFIDGDNLKLFGENMRLIDIDAAERGQTCNAASGGTWDCANTATETLKALVRGRTVFCQYSRKDRYGRPLAKCWVDGVNIAEALVDAGVVWAYRDKGPYVPNAKAAKKKGIGIWQADTQTPWDWRAEKRSASGS
ncbi:thermonuclease family protein [Cognatishimia sp. D5M38]|uniref:Thermonuclease family protein n=1 Tax=Cognatishimia coralii TaxID=3083254 RepID=A0ABU8QLH6_9RHOB